MQKNINPSDVEFWMDMDQFSNYIVDSSEQTIIFNIDLVKLASIRAAISNFVRILARRPIPVYFHDDEQSFNSRGKAIYISAKITNLRQFERAVGLALHEAAHTLWTDFDQVLKAWANIPHEILSLSDKKNIRRATLEKFIHGMWNIIEDRYIDNFVFNEAPGYRGYYISLYDDLNNDMIGEYLKSDYFRHPSLKSYDFRISNFTNEATDLLALPRLEEIAETINISNIDRLHTTEDRIKCAFDVTKIVLECIDEHLQKEERGEIPIRGKDMGLANPSDFFDFGDGEEQEEDEPDSSTKLEMGESEEIDVGKQMIGEISDIVQGKMPESENFDATEKISDEPPEKEVLKEINKLIKIQKEFITGNVKKEAVTSQQKALLDLIEKHGITMVRVDIPITASGNDTSLKVDCIVVKKMTKELILSGEKVFPLSGAMKFGDMVPVPPPAVKQAVQKGIRLGTKLGRKLQIRAESNPIKIIRKTCGKINRRQLHEAGFDAEDLFYKMIIDKRPEANLHISVDASSSMAGEKWYKTMTAVTAICKAASMIDNIHITVSFRTTQESKNHMFPYIILAYDSKHDKFSKIKELFPYLTPSGCTPEGLAFSAVMNLFEGITPDEEERFLLNLSDGEPYFQIEVRDTSSSIFYHDEIGVYHTKTQIDKIRRQGIEILSYFIKSKHEENSSKLEKNFRRMYGKNAKFIDVESVIDLAKTINELFLRSFDEKIS
ncbi:MAG TPA: hypothetical protein PKX15_02400 [Bacteroidales bacterium]|nr:hypothetical protein [Bacteroidales bacterium]